MCEQVGSLKHHLLAQACVCCFVTVFREKSGVVAGGSFGGKPFVGLQFCSFTSKMQKKKELD